MVKRVIILLILLSSATGFLYAQEGETTAAKPETAAVKEAEEPTNSETPKMKFSGIGINLGAGYHNYVNLDVQRQAILLNVVLNVGGDAYIGLTPMLSLHLGFLEFVYPPIALITRGSASLFFELAPIVPGLNLHNFTKNDIVFFNFDVKLAFYALFSELYLGPRVSIGFNLQESGSSRHRLMISLGTVFHIANIWGDVDVKAGNALFNSIVPSLNVSYSFISVKK